MTVMRGYLSRCLRQEDKKHSEDLAPRCSFTACLRLSMLLSCVILVSCSTLRGAPPSPFPKNYTTTDPRIVTETDITALTNTQDLETRNKEISKIYIAINLGYGAYKTSVLDEQRHKGALTSLFSLMAGIAGTLTDSVSAKDNYLALGTLLTGASQNYDANYMYNNTSIAIISAMDTKRAIVAARIAEGRNQPIEAYSGFAAFDDLVEYYNAGTLVEAFQTLQDQASAARATSQTHLASIKAMTPEEITTRRSRSTAIYGLTVDSGNKDKVLLVLQNLGVAGIDSSTSPADLQTRLQNAYQDGGAGTSKPTDIDIYNAFKQSGLIK